ncbi:MAG TPA: AMP-binding protein [Acidimicrobiales bacterium]|nr:AMP-binding protein [Acidimicrobiales bacterium]
MSLPAFISIGAHVTMWAQEKPDDVALIVVARDRSERSLTWRELDEASNRYARLLQSKGVDADSTVGIGLPNSIEHVVTLIATWKLGACVLPLDARMPAPERDALLDLAKPAAVVAAWTDVPGVVDVADAASFPADALPDVTPHPGRAIASGGSTGRPKIIVDPMPLAVPKGAYAFGLADLGVTHGQRHLVGSPLFHNFGNGQVMVGVYEAHTLIVMERFDAELALDIVEQHRVQYMTTVPTMMQRMLRVPDVAQRDLSSVEGLLHTAAVCPPWVKRGWIDLIGATKVHEVFGSTEAVGACLIHGDEWLERPGSVGRPMRSQVRVLDDDGNDLPPGEVGEIFMRQEGLLPTSDGSGPSFQYLGGASIKGTDDGFSSVGDLGWLDDEGFLFLADRRVDIVITGGSNVYPAEVEAALSEHPGVVDVGVVGVPDDDLGKRVHAIVQPADPAPTAEELRAHCTARLTQYKVPRSFEFVEKLPRNDAGKLRRSALVAERS